MASAAELAALRMEALRQHCFGPLPWQLDSGAWKSAVKEKSPGETGWGSGAARFQVTEAPRAAVHGGRAAASRLRATVLTPIPIIARPGGVQL